MVIYQLCPIRYIQKTSYDSTVFPTAVIAQWAFAHMRHIHIRLQFVVEFTADFFFFLSNLQLVLRIKQLIDLCDCFCYVEDQMKRCEEQHYVTGLGVFPHFKRRLHGSNLQNGLVCCQFLCASCSLIWENCKPFPFKIVNNSLCIHLQCTIHLTEKYQT